MTATHDHEPAQFYWDADTEYCPHKPQPERYTDAWDEWMCNHQPYDDGILCLDAPAGTGCPACSEEYGEAVLWADCKVREHARPKQGMAPNPDAEHQPVTVLVGTYECLDRECEEYFTDDGEDNPAVDVCSHIREEIACSCQRQDDGEYSSAPCTAAQVAVAG